MTASSQPVQDAKLFVEDAGVLLLGLVGRAAHQAREEKRLAPDRSMG